MVKYAGHVTPWNGVGSGNRMRFDSSTFRQRILNWLHVANIKRFKTLPSSRSVSVSMELRHVVFDTYISTPQSSPLYDEARAWWENGRFASHTSSWEYSAPPKELVAEAVALLGGSVVENPLLNAFVEIKDRGGDPHDAQLFTIVARNHIEQYEVDLINRIVLQEVHPS